MNWIKRAYKKLCDRHYQHRSLFFFRKNNKFHLENMMFFGTKKVLILLLFVLINPIIFAGSDEVLEKGLSARRYIIYYGSPSAKPCSVRLSCHANTNIQSLNLNSDQSFLEQVQDSVNSLRPLLNRVLNIPESMRFSVYFICFKAPHEGPIIVDGLNYGPTWGDNRDKKVKDLLPSAQIKEGAFMYVGVVPIAVGRSKL